MEILFKKDSFPEFKYRLILFSKFNCELPLT